MPLNIQQPMRQIWQVVNLIPRGQVSSYGKVADLAGLPRRARYVSTALKRAPQHLNLPWHRVISSQGKIAFPQGHPLFREQVARLLDEEVEVNCGKIKLEKYQWQPDMATLILQLDF